LLRSADCLATLAALRDLGVEITELADGRVMIAGKGPEALREPETALDAGNSGTTLRLLAGLLAGRPFFSILTGDASLRSRPMRRVVDPLTAMGATLLGRAGGQYPPLAIQGRQLSGISWASPVASAQVKSAILLAGIQATGETSVTEPMLSRDHTERMLAAFGVPLRRQGTTVSLRGPVRLRASRVAVPGDLSSAAFFLVAAAASPCGGILVRDVGVNPTRSGVLEILEAMGATITRAPVRTEAGEPLADLSVRGTRLHGTKIGAELIPRLLDEIPVLAVAAALAQGETVVSGAAELRVKEVDRLSALAGELAKLGVQVAEEREGLRIAGGRRLRGAVVKSRGDHRMAMALAVAGLFADGETRVEDVACVETSFPRFVELLAEVAPECAVREVQEA
jgi:3-phosphoshikimate 1-carboxyvinyltransferase